MIKRMTTPIKDGLNLAVTKENNHKKGLDRNLEDDWIPDQQRKSGNTSKELPEYGGDLKRKDTIKEKKNPASQKDQNNYKKKNV